MNLLNKQLKKKQIKLYFFAFIYSFLVGILISATIIMDITAGIDIKNNDGDENTYAIDSELAANLNDENTSMEKVNIVDFDQYKDVLNFDILYMTLLTKIPGFILAKFKSLEFLRLNGAGIQFLSSNTFINGENLIQLDLKRNKIYSLTRGIFNPLANLELLNLAANGITTIEDGTFEGLTSLKYLYLEENNLTKVTSKTFAGLPNLQELLLGQNRIETVEFDEANMPELQLIRLSGNELKVLPSLEGFPRLEKAYFAQNQFTSIGSTFERLEALYVLDVCDNPDLQLDLIDVAARHPQLTYLLVANTGLRLPQNSSASPADVHSEVRRLDLARNNLSHTTILKHLAFFQELKHLDLSQNRFKHFSVDQIDTLFPHLESINLVRNPLNDAWLEEALPILQANNIQVRIRLN